jgi:ABC-type Fe3+ transport system permease subunit
MSAPRHEPSPPARRAPGRPAAPAGWGPRAGVWLAGAAGAGLPAAVLVLPVGRVFITAFLDGDGSAHAGPLQRLLRQGLMREAFFNSLTWP